MAILGKFWRRGYGPGKLRFWRQRWLELAVGLILLSNASDSSAEVSREYQLKSVLLYHLTQFIEWPTTAFTNAESLFVIGILGRDPFGSVLDEAVRDERVNGRQIVIARCRTVKEAENCHLLFISSSEKDERRKVLAQLRGRSVLTVADWDGFIRQGGMIQFYENADNKIRLRINLEEAKTNRLNISAKLLRIAEIRKPQED